MNKPFDMYCSRTGTKRNRALIKHYGWRWLVGPLDMGGPILDGLRHAVDNGAWPCFTAFEAGKRSTPILDLKRFLKCIARHGATADFIIIPDIVQGGALSWAMTRYWRRRLLRDRRFKGVRLLIAVQNGMTIDQVRPYVGGRVGIFVGGDAEWKMATAKAWCALADERGTICHVGRVNTSQRMEAVGSAGAHSCDGSSGARFAVTIPPLDRTRRNVIAKRSQMDIEEWLCRAA